MTGRRPLLAHQAIGDAIDALRRYDERHFTDLIEHLEEAKSEEYDDFLDRERENCLSFRTASVC